MSFHQSRYAEKQLVIVLYKNQRLNTIETNLHTDNHRLIPRVIYRTWRCFATALFCRMEELMEPA